MYITNNDTELGSFKKCSTDLIKWLWTVEQRICRFRRLTIGLMKKKQYKQNEKF